MTVTGVEFLKLGVYTAEGKGIPNLRFATYPGAFMIHTPEELRKNVKEVLLPQIVKALTEPIAEAQIAAAEPGSRDIVCTGTFEEVNEYFLQKRWSDGLPIVPPTMEKVEEFLKYTDRSPDEVIGALDLSGREATPWSIAVNGVMAGCRPEYMPVLIAIGEVLADPGFGLKSAGSTSGVEPIIILNGNISKQLGFNSGTALLRPGNQANSSVGRFLRLCMRNIAGFLPGVTDMAAFGRNFFSVLVEDEVHSPWEPLNVTKGFSPGTSTVMLSSVSPMHSHLPPMGDTAEELLNAIAMEIGRAMTTEMAYIGFMKFNPESEKGQMLLVLLTPPVADVIAKGGYSKKDVQEYFYEHTKIPASEFDRFLPLICQPYSLRPEKVNACERVKNGFLPAYFCESTDPERLVPQVYSPDNITIIVAGNPGRNRFSFIQQHGLTLTIPHEVKLPANWDALMKELGK
ncbi:hypothetical protein ACFLXU_01095 [Chloroflexota bacterium]